jgi:NAD-dependent deacetylase
MQKLVVISGSGISQESGIPTYRDMGGLWEKYSFEELASPMGWINNPELVLKFYNARRKQLLDCEPNQGHKLLAELENQFDVQIITQNVDDLHERAGSKNILHLHGEIRKARSTVNHNYVVDIEGANLNIGDKCPEGSQLRPHVVWFGEEVSQIPKAIKIVESADTLVVIGTSLNVYPAASLIYYATKAKRKFLIDPGSVANHTIKGFRIIREKACKGVEILIKELDQNS